MRRLPIHILTCCLALTIGACSPSAKNDSSNSGDSDPSKSNAAETKQNKIKKSLDEWKIVFAEMQQVLELSNDESEKLKQTFEHQVNLLKQWYDENGAKIAEGDRQIRDAARDRNLAAVRKIQQEVGAVKRKGMAMHAAMDAAVLQALSESHRHRWLGHRLAARFLQLTEPLKLSDEQKTQINQLAIDAAKQTSSTPNPQAAGFLELEKKAEAQVLNATQKSDYAAIKKRNKMRSLKTYSSYQPTNKNR